MILEIMVKALLTGNYHGFESIVCMYMNAADTYMVATVYKSENTHNRFANIHESSQFAS